MALTPSSRRRRLGDCADRDIIKLLPKNERELPRANFLSWKTSPNVCSNRDRNAESEESCRLNPGGQQYPPDDLSELQGWESQFNNAPQAPQQTQISDQTIDPVAVTQDTDPAAQTADVTDPIAQTTGPTDSTASSTDPNASITDANASDATPDPNAANATTDPAVLDPNTTDPTA